MKNFLVPLFLVYVSCAGSKANFGFKGPFTGNRIGTIGENGAVYQAYNDLFVLRAPQSHMMEFTKQNLFDTLTVTSYHVVIADYWNTTIILDVFCRPHPLQNYNFHIEEDVQTLVNSYVKVYDNKIETDSMRFFVSAYAGRGASPYGISVSDTRQYNYHITSLLCYSDNLQMRLMNIDHDYLGDDHKDSSKFQEGKLFDIFRLMEFSEEMRGFNFPEPPETR